MDMDIFKRKLNARGYMFPKTDEGLIIYKPFKLKVGNNVKEYTVESTSLVERSAFMSSITIYITRFIGDGDRKPSNVSDRAEEQTAEIICKNLTEVESAVENIERLIEGNPKSPFDQIISNDNLRFVSKKNGWVNTKK